MQSDVAQLIATIVVGSSVVILLGTFLVTFLFLYQRKKYVHIKEKNDLKLQYEQVILQAQVEIQNQTLQHVGSELHDNIGQLLSVIRLHLNTLEESNLPGKEQQKIQETNELTFHTIQELRALSKSMDGSFVNDFGLTESIAHELERIRRTGHVQTNLLVEGQPYPINSQKEIVLFRITQEVLNNALKHAQARTITITVAFHTQILNICIKDDGKGFDQAEIPQKSMEQVGSGLRNMQRRASLIGATFALISQPGSGTSITLSLPKID